MISVEVLPRFTGFRSQREVLEKSVSHGCVI
jgi:hypothetical protein